MSTPADWVKAFGRQADADFRTWQAFDGQRSVPKCHGLLFLQMACEKLCKAHLISGGASPGKRHAFIAKHLPVIVKREIVSRRRDVKGMGGVLEAARHLAREIELLNPAVDRDARRPDNCEYPWEDDSGVVRSPLDWTFYPSRLLTAPNGRTLLKLMRMAIDRLLR